VGCLQPTPSSERFLRHLHQSEGGFTVWGVACRNVWILNKTVEEKRFYWHNLSHSAWPWWWRENICVKKKQRVSIKVCMCGVSTQQWPSTQITLFERTRQKAWLDDLTLWRHHLTRSEWILVYHDAFFFEKDQQPNKIAIMTQRCFLRRAPNFTFSKFLLLDQNFAAGKRNQGFWNGASCGFN